MNRDQQTFANLHPELRIALARFLKKNRRRDRGKEMGSRPWLRQTRGLIDYCRHLGVSVTQILHPIERRLRQGQRLRVIDIGVGKGQAIRDLREALGNERGLIHFSGIGLTSSPFPKNSWYSHHVGIIETLQLPPNRYDLIISVRGGLCYTLHSFKALEHTLNALKLPGVAYLQEGRFLLSQKWFQDFLKSQGYELEVTRREANRDISFKIVKLTDSLINLKDFSKLYLKELNAKKQILKEWEFDRIPKNSPLTEVLGSLYKQEKYKELIKKQSIKIRSQQKKPKTKLPEGAHLKIEFLNLNQDPKLDPEFKEVPLSQDEKNKPPAYCLPWVEASKYTIQLKANADYTIRKNKNQIEAFAEEGGKILPTKEIWIPVPEGLGFVPRNEKEHFSKKVRVSVSPSFSSPWQRERSHSITLKLGICWWTPPGWGLFFTSAIHRNEGFRVVEGVVRTDLWHRDIPIVIQPLADEVRLKKGDVVASALLVKAEDINLESVKNLEDKIPELIEQVNLKRTRPHIYKELLLPKKRKTKT